MPLPRSSEASALVMPEICHSLVSRYAEIASAATNERERPVFLASCSRRLLVERPTRTENVVVIICVQYSTVLISCTKGLQRRQLLIRRALPASPPAPRRGEALTSLRHQDKRAGPRSSYARTRCSHSFWRKSTHVLMRDIRRSESLLYSLRHRFEQNALRASL